MRISTCYLCGKTADFSYQANPEAVTLDYCHNCYEMEYPEDKAIKDMALQIAEEEAMRRMN
jgi:ribosome-binding protein aMBF1 (putative translation factor)